MERSKQTIRLVPLALRRALVFVGAAIGIASIGCTAASTATRTPRSAAPAPALYVAPADRVVTSTLLDFDSGYDTTFVDAKAIHLVDDPGRPGNRTLVVDDSVRLNLGSLVRGRDFGGVWDVIGFRVRTESPASIDVTLRRGSNGSAPKPTRVVLQPHAWTNVWLDVSPESVAPSATQATTAAGDDAVSLSIAQSDAAGQPVRFLIDDVALAQSHVTVSESSEPKTGEHWSVARVGLQWRVSIDHNTIFQLPAAPFVAGAYQVVEAVPTRALFQDAAGSTISIDRTGRLIEDGRAKLDPRVLKTAKAIAECASPARIEIVDDEGRVERSLPGDHNNDGFDEVRGCYTVHAIAGRAAVRLTRQGATVKWPVLEILDLPPGPINVWVEGEIVPWAVRADDGRVIVELPVELERPVEAHVSVK